MLKQYLKHRAMKHYLSHDRTKELTMESHLLLYARRMRELELSVRELLAAAQLERKAKLDTGQVDTVFKVGDQVLLLTKELLDAAALASCGSGGRDPSLSRPARAPTVAPHLPHSSGRCCAALR